MKSHVAELRMNESMLLSLGRSSVPLNNGGHGRHEFYGRRQISGSIRPAHAFDDDTDDKKVDTHPVVPLSLLKTLFALHKLYVLYCTPNRDFVATASENSLLLGLSRHPFSPPMAKTKEKPMLVHLIEHLHLDQSSITLSIHVHLMPSLSCPNQVCTREVLHRPLYHQQVLHTCCRENERSENKK